MLAVGVWGGSETWTLWRDHQREAARAAVCKPHIDQAVSLDEQARDINIPLILNDATVSRLQLRHYRPSLSQELEWASTNATAETIATAYREKRSVAGQAARVVLDHRSCFDDYDVEAASRIQETPTEVTGVEMPSGAHCQDGWSSSSIGRQGACSHHGGVSPAKPWATLYFN